jgi:hypothetical protein
MFVIVRKRVSMESAETARVRQGYGAAKRAD